MAYTPHAPSPFIVSTDSPLSNLLEGYKKVDAGDSTPYAVFDKPIEQSPNDDRQYRLIMLENGMEALLISDPTTDKAAAAMDVKVGHLSDPEDLQGLAHFCEHLMFMGTEKYPKENDYTEFLTQHSGSSNAFTGMDQTCYFFDVSPAHLEPALDRFAQFFISPLFDPSCTEREANAVNSENSKNLHSDMWRWFQLDKSSSSRKHSYWRFGTGNKETLWDEPMRQGIDVRERLIQWQQKHYSANLMKLVVVTKDSLDSITKTVVEKFSAAPNKGFPPPEFPGSPYTEDELQRVMFVKAVRDVRQLEISFVFPDESAFYATKPGSFLSHLIGHEGQGSVLSYLKKKGWANGMSAGAGNGAIGFEFFKISVDLTKEGLEHYEDVTSVIFAYIDLLRSSPPSEWAFKEVAQLADLAFQFKEKSPPTGTVMSTSLSMSKPYPRDLLLSAPYKSTEWNPRVVKELLDRMTQDQCRITVASQNEIGGRTYDQKEKWYGTEYTIEPFSDNLKAPKSAKDFEDLAVPRPNEFVPSDLGIKNKVEVAEPSKRPLSLRNTPVARLWHKKDDRWWVPRAAAFFLIRSPLVDDSALHTVQSRLYTELVKDALVEYSYDAELAGLSYQLDTQADGILLTVDGYNDKLEVLAKVVLEKMKDLKVDEERFNLIMDQLKRAFVNHRLSQPYEHAAFHASHLTSEIAWTRDEQLVALDEVTPANLQEYITRVFSRAHIETLVHGNMLKDEALALSKLAETTIDAQPLTPEELRSHRALIVPEGKHLRRIPVANPENPNSALEQFTYVGNIYDDLERAKLSVFATIVQEPLFDDLRAKQQLGYVVSSGSRRSIAYMGLRVIVQSEKDAAFVESRVDAFWDEFKQTLEDMSEEEFEKYKQTVIDRKLEDHKNMWEESSHLWLHIHAGWYDFEQRLRDVPILKSLTKDSIIEFYNKHFFGTAEHPIRRLSIYLDSQRLQPEQCLALAPAIQQLGLPIDEAQITTLVASRPTIDQLKAFALPMLQAANKSEQEIQVVMNMIDQLDVKQTPADYNLIEDVATYKDQAERAPYATPVAEYSDLIAKV